MLNWNKIDDCPRTPAKAYLIAWKAGTLYGKCWDYVMTYATWTFRGDGTYGWVDCAAKLVAVQPEFYAEIENVPSGSIPSGNKLIDELEKAAGGL